MGLRGPSVSLASRCLSHCTVVYRDIRWGLDDGPPVVGGDGHRDCLYEDGLGICRKRDRTVQQFFGGPKISRSISEAVYFFRR